MNINYANLSMHFFRESVQYGIFIPNVCFIFDLSKTEKLGRTTLEGNSSL